MSKEIIEYNEKFISKIKDFFIKLFGGNVTKKIQENIESKNIENKEKFNNNSKDTFKEKIEVKTNEEKIRLLNLQKEYKKGNIREVDMTDEDYEKLIELYKKQNQELRDKIIKKKQIIRKKLDNLKVS